MADLFAEKAIRLISENLRIAYARGSKHADARYHMAIAAGLPGSWGTEEMRFL